jgi:hypothetical protein
MAAEPLPPPEPKASPSPDEILVELPGSAPAPEGPLLPGLERIHAAWAPPAVEPLPVPANPTPRIAILGSCVSRDALEIAPAPVTAWTLGIYCARSTILSMMAEPFADFGAIEDSREDFQTRCAKADVQKGVYGYLARARADWLVLDLIDERHYLVVDTEGAAATVSKYASEFLARNGRSLAGLNRVDPRDPSRTERTLQVIPLFAERLLRVFPANRIVLHEAFWAKQYLTMKGRVRPLAEWNDGHWPEEQTVAANAELTRYYEALVAAIPGVKRIRCPNPLTIADEGHKWQAAPFHYIPDYYTAFRRALAAITGVTV